jgi:hypothetical protein
VLSAVERAQETTVTATMPGDVVELLRGALYADLEWACEDMPSTEPKTRASWAGVLRRLEQARRALDVIGWASRSEQQPLTLAVDAAMIEALKKDAEQWEWASEQETIESAEGRAWGGDARGDDRALPEEPHGTPRPHDAADPRLRVRACAGGHLRLRN